MTRLPENRGFWKVFFFSLFTFGIYGLYLFHAFAKETNLVCQEDGRHTRGLLAYIVFSILTLGIYQLIWFVKIIERRGNFCIRNGVNNRLTGTFYLLTVFIFSWLTFGICAIILAVKFIHQQNDVNKIYNQRLRSLIMK